MRPRLTERETEVFDLTREGCTTQETAQKMGIAPETVKQHKKGIIRKFRARNMVHAVEVYHRTPTDDRQRITSQAVLKYRLRISMMKLEKMLNEELEEVLSRAMKA